MTFVGCLLEDVDASSADAAVIGGLADRLRQGVPVKRRRRRCGSGEHAPVDSAQCDAVASPPVDLVEQVGVGQEFGIGDCRGVDGPVRGAEQATCLIAREREPSEESQQLKAFGIADQALP